jgi:putative transposase
VGVRPCRAADKKTLIASERDRPTWRDGARRGPPNQGRIDPCRFVFIDETWTNRAPLRGWAPRGQRLKVPHRRWKTMTFLAALRHDRIDAPWLIDGPINGERFRLYSRGAGAVASAGRHRHPR